MWDMCTVFPQKRASRTVFPQKRASRTVFPQKRASRTVFPQKRESRTVFPQKRASRNVFFFSPNVEKYNIVGSYLNPDPPISSSLYHCSNMFPLGYKNLPIWKKCQIMFQTSWLFSLINLLIVGDAVTNSIRNKTELTWKKSFIWKIAETCKQEILLYILL